MHYLLHGEHLEKSRNRLQELVAQAKETNTLVQYLHASEHSLTEIQQALGTIGLFGDSKLVVLEQVYSLRSKKLQKQLEALLTKETLPVRVILWEQKKLTASQKKNYSSFTIEEFSPSKELFSMLGKLGVQHFPSSQFIRVCEQESLDLTLYMLTRHFSQLLQVLDGSFTGPAWQQGKLTTQAKKIGETRLTASLAAIAEVDYQFKSGILSVDRTTGIAEALIRALL